MFLSIVGQGHISFALLKFWAKIDTVQCILSRLFYEPSYRSQLHYVMGANSGSSAEFPAN